MDPVARNRPSSLEHALQLLDEQHRVLLMRGQAHGKEGKSVGDEPKAPKKPDKPKGPGPSAPPTKPKPPKTKGDRQSKRRNLPFDEYIAELHGLDLTAVRTKLKDPTGGCVVCGKPGHKVSACPVHRRLVDERKAKRPRPEN
jgi:hypothetical protein